MHPSSRCMCREELCSGSQKLKENLFAHPRLKHLLSSEVKALVQNIGGERELSIALRELGQMSEYLGELERHMSKLRMMQDISVS